MTEDADLTYWRHHTPVGVKVEEISGGTRYSGRVWELMARQVWNENGRDGDYRNVEHTDGGVPLLADVPQRISLSHTPGMLVVATLPPTPEVDLSIYTQRAAMGVDTERMDRQVSEQVRQRVFSASEQAMIAAGDRETNILGWTCKEALFKAVQGGAQSWTDDYTIEQLPDMHTGATGRATVHVPSGDEKFVLYSYLSGRYIITLALSAKCATYKKTTD